MNVASTSPQDQTIATADAVALNFQGEAPEWVELIPAGDVLRGHDGRSWINPDPHAVIAATPVAARPLVIDWEHATQVRGEQGLDAPAAAWVRELEVRDGAIWGRAEWTAKARSQIEAKEYRLLSPVFGFDRATTRITRLLSAALTNFPNLTLTALNREGLHREPLENTLSIAIRLATVLGLAATATEDEIVTAVTEARAANRPAAPDLTNYAPRSDLTAALNRATTAETTLAALQAADQDRAIDAAINGAMDAGKIVPASADTYRAMCREEGGLERFTALVATLPVIAGAAESRAQNRAEDKAKGKSALNADQLAVCRALGQSEAEFLKSDQAKEG